MRYRLSTLLIVLAVGPPVLAGVLLLFKSSSTRPMLVNIITFAASIAAVTWLCVRWPETFVNQERKWIYFPFSRFSLRPLLLFVTAICVFCAYQVHWCDQRRDYMLQWHSPGWPANRHTTAARRTIEMNSPSFSDRGAPYLLWLFGERRAVSIWVSVGINDVTRMGGDAATIKRSDPALSRAMNLFPECQEFTVVCKEMMTLEIEIVD